MVTIEGRKLITSFNHVRPNPETQVPGGTYCYIKVYDPALKDEDREVVAVGYAQMHFKDKEFNKQVGRKWALQYALGLSKIKLRAQHGKGRKEMGSVFGTQFTKEQRNDIWVDYWKTHRMGPLSRVKQLQTKIAALERDAILNSIFGTEEPAKVDKALI